MVGHEGVKAKRTIRISILTNRSSVTRKLTEVQNIIYCYCYKICEHCERNTSRLSKSVIKLDKLVLVFTENFCISIKVRNKILVDFLVYGFRYYGIT